MRVIKAQSPSSQDSVRLSGQVTPWREATVAAEAGEQVVALPVEVGQRVAAGAPLARLDDAAARATLAEAEAGLAQATAARRQAEAEYRRAEVETRAAIDAAAAQVAQADAGGAQARAQRRQATEGERKARSATRTQELRQAEAALRQAEADERLQKQERDRYEYLVREGAVGHQVADRVRAAHDAAVARRESAEEAVSLAKEGARAEDIATAEAGVAQATAAVQNAAARRSEAEAALAQARTRDTRLAVIRRQIDALRAQEDRARASVRQARILVGKHRVDAPFAGRVLAKLTERGETLAPGTPVARIGDISRVKVTFQTPEAARLALRPGQRVRVTADALPGRAFAGVIETVGYQADPRARTFGIEVRVANPDEALLPNMVARLALPAAGGEKVAGAEVPIGAVASDGARRAYVLTVRGGRAARRDVTLGPVRGERVAVLSGLAAGEAVVADPQRLSDGATVEVLGKETTR